MKRRLAQFSLPLHPYEIHFNTNIKIPTIMKKLSLLLVALFIAMLAAPPLSAAGVLQSGSFGAGGNNLNWSLTDDYVLTISGTGATGDYSSSSDNLPPWSEYQYSIQKVVIGEGVTSIGACLFAYHGFVKEVEIPSTVQSIGDEAFSGVEVGTFNLPAGLLSVGKKAFAYNWSLTSIVIPDGVTSLGDSLFYNCQSLASVSLPEDITSIPACCFEECSALASVAIPSSVTVIGEKAFAFSDLKSVTLPAGLLSIGESAFSCPLEEITSLAVTPPELLGEEEVFPNSHLLERLNVPDGCALKYMVAPGWRPLGTKIVDNAMNAGYLGYGLCGAADEGANLTWTLDHDGFLTISGSGAMADYDGNAPWSAWLGDIKYIRLSDGITRIGSTAFAGCEAVGIVIIPATVTSVGWRAFYDTQLSLVFALPSVPPVLEGDALGVNDISLQLSSASHPAYSAAEGWSGYSNVYTFSEFGYCGAGHISDVCWMTDLSGNMFIQPTYVTGVAMADYASASEVPWAACAASVSGLIIYDGVTHIGSYAFSGCSAITALNLPADVASVGDYAFSGCSALQKISVYRQVPPAVFANTFNGVPRSIPVVVPDVQAYKTAEHWSGFTNFTNIIAEGNCGANGNNLTFRLTADGALTISGSGDMADFEYQPGDGWGIPVPWIDYADQIKSVVLPDGLIALGKANFANLGSLEAVTLSAALTRIPFRAFSGCGSLKSLNFPDAVAEIDTMAFIGCVSLAEVNLPASLSHIRQGAFANCHALTSVVLPEGVTVVEDYAFQNCSSLASVSLPNTVVKLYPYSFSMCSALQTLTIPASVNEIGKCAFWQSGLTEITIPNTVTTFGDFIFWDCQNLASVTLPDNITVITPYMFAQCTNLQTLTIPASVTEIGEDAFWQSGLTEIVIPNSVTGIGKAAFNRCGDLVSVKLPDNLAVIDSFMFVACYNLKSIEIPASVRKINYAAFNASGLTSVTIPEGVTELPVFAFMGSSSLESVVLPLSLTAIGDTAFTQCYNLSSVAIPQNVTRIGHLAFYSTSLAEVELPASVNSIGELAFGQCTDLKKITLRATTPPSLASSNIVASHIPVFVEDAVLADYKAAPYWQDLNIQPLSKSSLMAYGYYGAEGDGTNIAWELDFDGVFTMTGTGAMAGWSEENPIPWEDYKLYITKVVLPEGLTNIGSYAFSGCENLTEISIPSTVTIIGVGAIRYCRALTSVVLPENLTFIGYDAFSQCGFTSILLPEKLETIDGNAFAFTSLTEVEIPASVTFIGADAFSISGLQSITVHALTPPGLGGDMADLGVVVYVEDEAYDAYLAAYIWNGHKIIPLSKAHLRDFGYCGADEDGKNLEWELTHENVLTVNGTGAMADFTQDTIPWLRYNGEIKSVVVSEGVTSIGNYAFYYHDDLASVSFPSTLETIGQYAFRYSSALTSVVIPDNVTLLGVGAFYGCTKLSSVNIPALLTSIDSYAFYNCPITSIELPAGLTEIQDDAFGYCTSLFEIKSNAVTPPTIYWESFLGVNTASVTVYVPNASVATYKAHEYWKEFNIKSVDEYTDVLAEGVCGAEGDGSNLQWTLLKTGELTITGTGAMADYTKSLDTRPWNEYRNDIIAVVVNEGVISLGDYAFGSFSNLASVTLPDGLTAIGVGSFSHFALANITLPASVATMGEMVFEYADLVSVNLPESLTEIPASAFAFSYHLQSVNIPDGVEVIGSSAFSNCQSLTSVAWTGVKTIGDNAFKGCYNLAAIGYSDVLETIGEHAFENCKVLTSFSFAPTVTSIGNFAFEYCDAITELEVRAVTPPTIYASTFGGVDKENTSVIVPKGSLLAYKADQYWAEFFNLQEDDGQGTGVDDVQNAAGFVVVDNTVRFEAETEVAVYTVSGICVYKGRTAEVYLPQSGIYVVVTPQSVQKVVIR